MTRDDLELLIGDIKRVTDQLEDVDGRQIPGRPNYELSESDGLEVGRLLLELEELIY